MSHKLKEGRRVKILRQIATLTRQLECSGGWIVDPPIKVAGCTCRYWNEDEMEQAND